MTEEQRKQLGIPDLETCQALVKAGWKKETYFVWVITSDWNDGKVLKEEVLPRNVNPGFDYSPFRYTSIPAMTLSEILEELPRYIQYQDHVWDLICFEGEWSYFHSTYSVASGSRGMDFVFEYDEPSTLYLKLKEEKLV